MKIVWIVLGVLAGLCLICGGGAYMIFNKGKAVFDDAGKYGDTAFRSIGSSWNLDTFMGEASPELIEQNDKALFPKIMQTYSERLGPLKDFQSKLSGFNSKNQNGDTYTTADWSADATFEKGKGSATMTLLNRNGTWKILNFHVQSSLLNGAPGDPAVSTPSDTPSEGSTTTTGTSEPSSTPSDDPAPSTTTG